LDPVEEGVAGLALNMAVINVVLGVFNLVPGFPLDGGRVLRSVFWGRQRSLVDATRLAASVGKYVAYGFMALGAVVAIVFGSLISGIWLFIIGNFLRSSSAASYEQVFVDKVLTGIPATAVATHEYDAVSPETTLSQLVDEHVLQGPHRCFPVMAGQELLGLVTLSDLRAVPRDLWPTTTVYRAMTPLSRLRTVTPKDDLPVVLQEMAAGDVNQVPLMDGKLLLGLIYRGDLLRYIQVRQALGKTETSAAATARSGPSRVI
jgi:CBS domain-containing protein